MSALPTDSSAPIAAHAATAPVFADPLTTSPLRPGAGAGLLLCALAVAVIALTRRRARPMRHVEVIESTGIGGKRALLVARAGNQTFLIGSSEAGVALLATLPALPSPPPKPEAGPAGIRGLLGRLRRPAAVEPAPLESFESIIAETAEEEALRRKIAAGRTGRVS